MWKKLKEYEVTIVLAIMILVMALPFINPIGFPLVIGEHAKALHNGINTLNEGDAVFVLYDFAAGTYDEIGSAAEAIIYQLFKKGVKILQISISEAGPVLFLRSISGLESKVGTMGKTYGEDWVLLGYFPGDYDAVYASIASDVHVKGVDYYGDSLDQIPMMANIRTIDDIAMVIACTQLQFGTAAIIRQWAVTYGMQIHTLHAGMVAPIVMPYYPDFLKSVVAGMRGSAEYESLAGLKGYATSSVDVLSMIYLYVIILVVIANVKYFLTKKGRTK